MTLLFAAGVAASVAVAKGPPPGKGKDKNKPSTSTSTSTTSAQSCHPKVAFILKGEFKGGAAASAPSAGSSSSALVITGSFEMDVKQANSHGRQYVGKTVTISVDAKTKFTRRGHADLEDFEAGDWLNVHVRDCKAKKPKKKDGTTSTSTSTTPTGTSTTPAPQALLLAKKVTGKPGAGTTTTTSP